MALTKYVDGPTMTALCIEESISYMFNQIGWEGFIRKKCPTYHKLTLEFLSSLTYGPNLGMWLNRGRASFRLFGFTYQRTTRKISDLLGFPNGLDAFTVAQEDLFMDTELNHFWIQISG